MTSPPMAIQTRPATHVFDPDDAARQHQCLRALSPVAEACHVKGRAATVRLRGVHRRAPLQEQPQYLQPAAPRRVHQRGVA